MRKYLPAIVFLLAITARLVPGTRTIDDAYITFRYARNILAGAGMVYNPGERVLGTTTPLYTGLMAFAGYFSGREKAPFPQLALSLNAIFDGLTCLLLIQFGKRLKRPRAGWGAAIVWAVLPFSVTFAIGGLETSLYILLLSACVYAHLSSRHIPAAFLAALSVLTRPDALILVAPLALDRLATGIPWHLRKSPLNESTHSPISIQEILAFALPALAWAVFALRYFGSPLPHSIAAKVVAYQIAPAAAFIRLLQHYATPFMGNQVFGVVWIGIGLVLYPFLFLVGARQAIQADFRTWPWLIYPWLYFAVYALANPLIFRWYLTPPLPAYIFVILAGIDKLLDDILARIGGWHFVRGVPVFFVLFAPSLLVLQGWQLRPDHGLPRPAPEMAWYQLELVYMQAARSLQAEIKNHSSRPTLAAGDVGVLGYYTSARILDTVGLNSPEAVPYYPTRPEFHANAYAVSPDLIVDQQPDYVVLLEVYGREGLFKDERFLEDYHLRRKIPADIYGSDGMLIFERNGLP